MDIIFDNHLFSFDSEMDAHERFLESTFEGRIYSPEPTVAAILDAWFDTEYDPIYKYEIEVRMSKIGDIQVRSDVTLGREKPEIIRSFRNRLQSFIEREINTIRYGY
jgi:hypothetical protein